MPRPRLARTAGAPLDKGAGIQLNGGRSPLFDAAAIDDDDIGGVQLLLALGPKGTDTIRAVTGLDEPRQAQIRMALMGTEPDAVRGARVVLLRLPRSLDALHDVAGLIAAHADPAAVVVAGGRLKHMTVAMNDVLREAFHRVDVTHARQKSRVLIARDPHDGGDPAPRAARVEATKTMAVRAELIGDRPLLFLLR